MPIQSDSTLEQLLAQWQARIATLSQALLKLENLPTYRAISEKSFHDLTEQDLLQSSYQLFEQFEQLVQVVEQAQALHQDSLGFLGNHQQATAALELLQGESIQLSPMGFAPGTVGDSGQSLGDRFSLSTTRLSQKLNPAAPQRMTPEQLLTQFSTQYQQLLDELQQWKQRQVQVARERTTAIAQIQSFCEQLNQRYSAAQAIQTDYQQKIAQGGARGSGPELPSAVQLQAITQAGEQLRQQLLSPTSENNLATYQTWQAEAQQLLQCLAGLESHCQQQLSLRQELRGRLDATKAKALALGQIETLDLSELAQSAERLLYSRPTPLEESQQLLQQYERTLTQLLQP